MKNIYDRLSQNISARVMYEYSTSFYLATTMLSRRNKQAIYALYGFVRLADEIVDSFHDFDKRKLLDEFESEFDKSIETKISINPIINSFQKIYHDYNFEHVLVKSFINSMRHDLDYKLYSKDALNHYIHGSAEVIGLMCLKIFVNGNQEKFTKLKESAISLGIAFQKINFLRDLKYDHDILHRNYFNIETKDDGFDSQKQMIVDDVKKEFKNALIGIKKLNKSARVGVFTAYLIFYELLNKIERAKSSEILNKRISVPKLKKLYLFLKSALTVFFSLNRKDG